MKRLQILGSFLAVAILIGVFSLSRSILTNNVIPNSHNAASANLSYSGFDGPAELPRVYIDTTMPTQTGKTWNVAAGDTAGLQSAIDNAQLGDTIVLPAGSTFLNAALTLKEKSGTGWIVIRTSAPDSSLPPPGTRITPSYAGVMAKLQADAYADPVVATTPRTNHYRFVGIEMSGSPVNLNYTLFQIGTYHDANWNTLYEKYVQDLPNNIVLDRVWIHGIGETQRCVSFNGAYLSVIDSYLSDCHSKGSDSQAIGGWNGPGPFKIVNNFLEGAGENVLFGGADPVTRLNSDGSPAYIIPSDMEIRNNYIFKDLAWAGGVWTVKNSVECKNCQRQLIEGNIFENNWGDAQDGTMVAYNAINQDNSAPWTTVGDITFRYNKFLNTVNGITISAQQLQGSIPPTPGARFSVHDNIFQANNIGFKMYQNLSHIKLDHNTFVDPLYSFGQFDTQTGMASDVTITNNLFGHGAYGLFSPGGEGTSALNWYANTWSFAKNVIWDNNPRIVYPSSYPTGNFFTTSIGAIGFTNPSAGDYTLLSTSPYKNAGTDGKDLGADIATLNQLTSGSVSGVWNGTVTPPPTPPPSPAPTVSVSANPTSITAGQSSTVSWSSTNATSCSSSQLGASLATAGSQTVTPSVTTTYSVTCTGSGGSASNSVTVTVSASTPPPSTNQLPIGNFDGIESDGVTIYGWSFDPDTSSQSNSVQIYADGAKGSGTLLATVPAGDSRPDVNTYYSITGNHGFSLAIPASLRDGRSHTYYVYGVDTSDSTITSQIWTSPQSFIVGSVPSPSAPTVTISASPSSITAGQSSTVSWSSTNATSCSSSQLGASLATAGSQAVFPQVTTTYTVSCTGSGGSATQSTTITVSTVPQTPPPSGFSAGDWIQLTSKTNVRSQPATGGKPLGSQDAGAKGQILAGPQNGSGYTWYDVDYQFGSDGWSIQDYMTKISAPAPIALGTRVTTTSRVNVRSGPGLSYGILGRQNNNSAGTITQGPTSADGYVWWYVDFDSGTDGWVAAANLSD